MLRNLVPHPPAQQIRYLESGPGEECTVRETCQAALAQCGHGFNNRLLTRKSESVPKPAAPPRPTCKLIGELLHQEDWYDDDEIDLDTGLCLALSCSREGAWQSRGFDCWKLTPPV